MFGGTATNVVMRVLIAALLIASAWPANGQAPMSVAAFIERAEALESRGVLGWVAADRTVLQREAQEAFRAWVRQARSPVACPPAGRQFQADPQRFLAMLRAVPPAERSRTSVREAFRRSWNARWPCR